MDETSRPPGGPGDGYGIMRIAVASYTDKDIVSTRYIINKVRRADPDCVRADEELTAILVAIAAERHIGVVFDIRPAD